MKYETTRQHYGTECVFYAISRGEFEPPGGLYAVRDS